MQVHATEGSNAVVVQEPPTYCCSRAIAGRNEEVGKIFDPPSMCTQFALKMLP